MSMNIEAQLLARRRNNVNDRLLTVVEQAIDRPPNFENVIISMLGKQTVLLEGIYTELKHMNDTLKEQEEA